MSLARRASARVFACGPAERNVHTTKTTMKVSRKIACSAALVTGAIGLLCSCSTVKLDHPASQEEYSGYFKKGNATLIGEAFATTKDGTVKYASGRLVHLDPASAYSTELFEKLRRHGSFWEAEEQDTVELDPRMLRYRRNALADSVGRFRFPKLAAGDYYVSCYISWMMVNGSWTGNWAIRSVRLADDETNNIILR
jgi:hypothetical protein